MNKRIAIIVGIIAIVLIGFGGKLYMDKKSEEKAREEKRNQLETERESAVVVKQTFANIKTLEFEKTSYNEMTGAYRMFVKMTTKEKEVVEFTYSFWKERNEIGGYGIENRKAQVKGTTTGKIIVNYSNGDEEEL